MFFTLAKIFWALAQPLSLIGLLLAVSVLAALLSRRRLAISASLAALLLVVLAGWTTTGALLLQPLEDRFARPAVMPGQVGGIIVLGGGFEGAINRVRGGYELNSGGDRYVEAAILARRFPQARVVVTGGSGALLLDGEGDGDTAPRLLTALGVEPARLVMEGRSRNTFENAVYSKEMLHPQPGQTWLLVTSAFHMPRSIGLFRKAGFDVVPWPVDYRTAGDERPGFARDNPLDSLQNLTVAMREWIGLFAYWATGRIDSPLPQPD
ncbi:MAG: YdcF family protein [Mesorhizobium sp.]|nr:YdcF family protein [Mesorhizobium sp.]